MNGLMNQLSMCSWSKVETGESVSARGAEEPEAAGGRRDMQTQSDRQEGEEGVANECGGEGAQTRFKVRCPDKPPRKKGAERGLYRGAGVG